MSGKIMNIAFDWNLFWNVLMLCFDDLLDLNIIIRNLNLNIIPNGDDMFCVCVLFISFAFYFNFFLDFCLITCSSVNSLIKIIHKMLYICFFFHIHKGTMSNLIALAMRERKKCVSQLFYRAEKNCLNRY